MIPTQVSFSLTNDARFLTASTSIEMVACFVLVAWSRALGVAANLLHLSAFSANQMNILPLILNAAKEMSIACNINQECA